MGISVNRRKMTVLIKKFNADDIKPDRIFLFVGKRGTGKSTLIRDIMYRIRDKVDIPIAMTPTAESCMMFESCMPKSCVYNEFSTGTVQAVVDEQNRLARRKQPQQHIMVVLDDMMFDKTVLKSKEVREIFMNGRHLKITFINAMQYVMDMGPDLRSQVDYVFALRDNILSNIMKLWKYFFGMFSNFQDFERTFKSLTDNNCCIVIDNTVKSNKVEDCIFWYKADINLPPYKIGRHRYWKLDQMHGRSEDEMEDRHGRGSAGSLQHGARIHHVEMEDGVM